MGLPFLEDADDPDKRREAITQEVEAYLWAIKNGEEEAELPEALYWLDMVERFGLPVAGGILDQPWHFMQDLHAAKLGVERYRAAQAANERLRAEWERKHANSLSR